MFRKLLLSTTLLVLISGAVLAQRPYAYQDSTIDAVESSSWVGADFGGRTARNWTVTLLAGECATGDSNCTTGTAPSACALRVEGCSELSSSDCQAADVIVTSSTVANCTTSQAVHHTEQFRWLRVTTTSFADSGTEILSEPNFATHVNWDVTGDFNDAGGNAAYTHATGSGTLTQVEADQASAAAGSIHYHFDYTVGSFTGDGACSITSAFASGSQPLTMSNGAHTTKFLAVANPGDFVISCTSTSGGFTLDDFSLQAAASLRVQLYGAN